MKIKDNITQILQDAGRPMLIWEICDEINWQDIDETFIEVHDKEKIVSSIIKHNNDDFENVYGNIFLSSDARWKAMLFTYFGTMISVAAAVSHEDLQFMLSCLFYFKRCEGLKETKKEYAVRYDLFQKINSTIDRNVETIAENQVSYKNIINEYHAIIRLIDDDKRKDLFLFLNQIDLKYLSDSVFGDFFEFIIHLNTLEKKSPIYYTPYALRRLMVGLLNPNSDKSIIDPLSGVGGLIIEAQKHAKNSLIATQYEITHRTALLNLMNLEMHGDFDTKVSNIDCFSTYRQKNHYDYVISDLPMLTYTADFLEGISQYWSIDMRSSKKGFSAGLLYIISLLKYDGKAVITVSESFLVKHGHDAQVRKMLIENDMIEAIIGLPSGTFKPFTDARAAVIVLNPNKTHKQKIKFLKAQITGTDRQNKILNVQEILSIYSKKEVLNTVDIRSLKNGYNLSPFAYENAFFEAADLLHNGNGKLLGELVEIKSGYTINRINTLIQNTIPYIKIENLSNEILNVYLNNEQVTSTISAEEEEGVTKKLISEERLLVARIGENLKPTYFKPNEQIPSILIHQGVFSLKPKNNMINLEYLYYQLHTTFIKEQISLLRYGAVMPYISIDRLKQVVIPYVDIRTQEEFVKTQKANIIATERAKIEEKIKLLNYQDDKSQAESEIVRTFIHQLRPTLTSLNLQAQKINRIVTDNKLMDKQEILEANIIDPMIADQLSQPKNYTLEEIVSKIISESSHLSDVLTTVDQVMKFKLTASNFEEIELFDFFNQYLKLKKSEYESKFNIELKGKQVTAMISPAAMKDLINQLLNNADQHAFGNGTIPVKKRLVSFTIRLSKERDVAIVEYQNNGTIFSIKESDFLSAFKKSQQSNGSGIGGNYIYRIIDAHQGKVIINEHPKIGFELKIEIPLKHNII